MKTIKLNVEKKMLILISVLMTVFLHQSQKERKKQNKYYMNNIISIKTISIILIFNFTIYLFNFIFFFNCHSNHICHQVMNTAVAEPLVGESVPTVIEDTGCFGRMKSLSRKARRYSIHGDSMWNNFRRNVWCNLKDLGLYTIHKITEPTNVSQSQRKNLRYDIIDLYKTVEEDPITLSVQTKEELRTKDICTRIVAYFLMEQTWLLLMLLGICSGMMAILLEFSVGSFISCRFNNNLILFLFLIL